MGRSRPRVFISYFVREADRNETLSYLISYLTGKLIFPLSRSVFRAETQGVRRSHYFACAGSAGARAASLSTRLEQNSVP